MRVRASIGTAVVLGLEKASLMAEPTTAYLMLYHEGRCLANCAFCSQARTSRARRDLLSRVNWPPYEVEEVLRFLPEAEERGLKRICIQTLLYRGWLRDLKELVRDFSRACDLPISISTQPLPKREMEVLKSLGAERISIPLDAATPDIFEEVKGRAAGGPYSWEGHLRALENALEVFGPGLVGTHLIIGLGETEEEAVNFMFSLYGRGIYVGLFAFTPIKGTVLEGRPRPDISSYRRIQLARYLISEGLVEEGQIRFDSQGRIVDFGLERGELSKIASTGIPFMTSGCPDCNRPFYNERPSGPIYNYPYKPGEEEIKEILSQLGIT